VAPIMMATASSMLCMARMAAHSRCKLTLARLETVLDQQLPEPT
jgi:hypothetical protein